LQTSLPAGRGWLVAYLPINITVLAEKRRPEAESLHNAQKTLLVS
jgi:hypothetical protein